jgi:hypothetical protein
MNAKREEREEKREEMIQKQEGKIMNYRTKFI